MLDTTVKIHKKGLGLTLYFFSPLVLDMTVKKLVLLGFSPPPMLDMTKKICKPKNKKQWPNVLFNIIFNEKYLLWIQLICVSFSLQDNISFS